MTALIITGQLEETINKMKILITIFLLFFSLFANAQTFSADQAKFRFWDTQGMRIPDTVTIIDADAQAFITAAGISDATQIKAINRLVLDLKGTKNPNYFTQNIWSKFKAIYPFVGGTSTTHKYNLIDPRDLDAAYRLTFTNSPTHNSSGITFNGTDNYADTHFNPSTLSTDGAGISAYSLTSSITNAAFTSPVLIGSTSGSAGGSGTYEGAISISIVYTGNGRLDRVFANALSGGSAGFPQNNYSGFLNTYRTSTTGFIFQRNGFKGGRSEPISTPTTFSIYIGAINAAGTAKNFTSYTCAFAAIYDGSLTNIEALAYYNAVQQFETTLNRQTY